MSILKTNQITDLGGNELLTSNGSGVISGSTLSNTPAFLAFPSGNQTISAGTFTKMNFATEKYDTDSVFDTSTSLFTVPSGKAGKYFFYASVCWLNSSAWSGQYIMRLLAQRSGSDLSDNRGFGYHTGSEEGGTVQFSIDLAVGDTVQFQAYHNSGASRDTYESTGTNRFGGYKLIGA
jgi:hypothetical protein